MIIQVGPYPEPIGGVSVFIKRMKEHLDILGIKNEVWDLNRKEKGADGVIQTRLRFVPFKLHFRKGIAVVHFNICGIKPKKYIGFFNKIFYRRVKKIITIHGDCENSLKKHRKAFIKALNTFDTVICVKEGDGKRLKEAGLTKPVYDIPAFLFPIMEKEPPLPRYVEDFFKDKSFIISSNATSMKFYNNADLYGIDMCIDLVIELKAKGIKIGMVFCLPNIDNEEYYGQLINKINENGIENDFLFIHENMELWPIIKKSNLFIRATNYDGYGVSIAEAIYCGVPAIASNVCVRPEGTILFQSRNLEELYKSTLKVIEEYELVHSRVIKVKCKDYLEEILKIYL